MMLLRCNCICVRPKQLTTPRWQHHSRAHNTTQHSTTAASPADILIFLSERGCGRRCRGLQKRRDTVRSRSGEKFAAFVFAIFICTQQEDPKRVRSVVREPSVGYYRLKAKYLSPIQHQLRKQYANSAVRRVSYAHAAHVGNCQHNIASWLRSLSAAIDRRYDVFGSENNGLLALLFRLLAKTAANSAVRLPP